MVKYNLPYPNLSNEEELEIAKSKGETFEVKEKTSKNIFPTKNKQVFKSSKLQVKVPYNKGDLLLKQRNAFFNDTYNREKENILSW